MIKVIDNFLQYPYVELARALLADYKDYTFPTGIYPCFSVQEDVESLEKISKELGKKLSYTLPPAYRKYEIGTTQPTFIHSDVAEGDVSAVIFLNQEAGNDNGLAFWKNKKTGMNRALLVGQEDIEHGQDEKNWEMVDFVAIRFGRAVIFDSSLYHSRYPKENWSVDLDNVRLIKVLFMKEIK